jgi:type I restriction enzyme M protein
MLHDIKELLLQYPYIDIYSGYQVIADSWRISLDHDLKIISESDFYTAGRLREPNMVVKGSGDKKREEQDGWNGLIVSNYLVEKYLYGTEQQAIEDMKNRVNDLDSNLAELLERAKVEDSAEENVLGDTLSEDKNSFQRKLVKAALKQAVKGSSEYALLAQVENIFAETGKVKKEIKTNEQVLKDEVEERILHLTDEEIDQLMYEKWFGHTVQDITDLVAQPVLKELSTLSMLNDRYANTLDDIDKELTEAEEEFAELQKELVVMP